MVIIGKHCFALLGSAVLVSACGNMSENTHCVKDEVRPIFMPVCIPDDASQCAYTRDDYVGYEVVCLARECDDGYKRDDKGKFCVPDLESRPIE